VSREHCAYCWVDIVHSRPRSGALAQRRHAFRPTSATPARLHFQEVRATQCALDGVRLGRVYVQWYRGSTKRAGTLQYPTVAYGHRALGHETAPRRSVGTAREYDVAAACLRVT
jgi:hypothetical protein